MITRYLDPTNDITFKKVFSDKGRLMDFLNAVLRLKEGEKIEHIDFISQEELPSFEGGRRSIFDLKCVDQSQKTYIIEMQNKPEASFLNRIQCYAAHAYVSQAIKGKSHDHLMPVILLSLTPRNLFEEDIDCISYHLNVESKTKRRYLFSLSYVFIELSKFKKTQEELTSVEDYWLYFLTGWQKTDAPPSTIKDPFVLEAYEAVEHYKLTEAEYDAYLKSRLALEADDLMMNKTFKDGEKLATKKIALQMHAMGMEIETISKAVNLPLSEIEEILKEKKPFSE